MRKTKYLLIVLFVALGLLLIPNSADAATLSSRDVYSNNGSMNFYFEDLTLDMTHEYEFGFTTTQVAEVTDWHLITEYTESTATVNINTGTTDLRNVFNASDTGYIRIKDVTTDEIVMEPYKVDLKMPYLKVANETVLNNGEEFDTFVNPLHIPLRNKRSSSAYFQYEKITDQNLIERYKEIKENGGDYNELEGLIKTAVPTSGWTSWKYWNVYDSNGMNGEGYPENPISVPDSGLYYMWIYFTGNNIKDIYGVILVDNLQPDVALESISLPETKSVELGDTLKLTPTFNPSTATNKIVTWSSSNEDVATVDNDGNVTPVSVGSTIITVTSEDGNHTATCTVTVTNPLNNNNNNNNNSNNNGSTNNNNDGKEDPGKDDPGKDDTVAPEKIPQTGAGLGIFVAAAVLIIGTSVTFIKFRKLRDIK